LVGLLVLGKALLSALCRLYEPSKGRIFLDGVDIRDLPQAELPADGCDSSRRLFLFAGEMKSNITLGDIFSG